MVSEPIWAFHDADDDVVSVEYSRDMIAAIQAAGGNPHYTEYATGGHDAWARAYNTTAMYAWMFNQPVPEPASLVLMASAAAAMGCYFSWRRLARGKRRA